MRGKETEREGREKERRREREGEEEGREGRGREEEEGRKGKKEGEGGRGGRKEGEGKEKTEELRNSKKSRVSPPPLYRLTRPKGERKFPIFAKALS